MRKVDSRESDRRERGIRNTERALFRQRAQILREMTKKLVDLIETTADAHIHGAALVEEIRDISSKLDEVSHARLFEQCLPPKDDGRAE